MLGHLLVVSAFLTPYSFSVTFFSLWPWPFFILLQINFIYELGEEHQKQQQ
jgi:hypothetical protein